MKIWKAAALLVSLSLAVFSNPARALDLSPADAARLSALSPAERAALLQAQGQAPVVNNTDNSLRADAIDKGGNTAVQTPAPEASAGGIKLFGYNIFYGGNKFEPTIQIPMPVNYVLGVGDTVVVNLYGKTSATYDLTVTREGNLEVPEMGIVNVAGLTFTEARQEVMRRVKNQMIGVEASVTMGELRSMKVYIMGEVAHPGSYAVSSLATITNALFACGGIKESGSLRTIQLKRSGKLVGEMDLYNLLMKGDNSQDLRLEPGDVILVPAIGDTATVTGNVVRPAIFEIKAGTKVSDLLTLAGGVQSDAYLGISQMTRMDPATSRRSVVSVDLSKPDQYAVENGDVLTVSSLPARIHDFVKISGRVAIPRSIQWHEGLRIADVISGMNDVLPDADLSYVLVKSVNPANDRISVRSTRLDAAMADPKSAWNIALSARDEILVLGDMGAADDSRAAQIESLLTLLRTQRLYDDPEPSVRISGAVAYPGEYPFEKDMKVLDLLRAAKNVLPETDMEYALLVRRDGARTSVTDLRLPASIDDGASEWNLTLQPRDEIRVFSIYGDRAAEVKPYLDLMARQTTPDELVQSVSLYGMVRHPGTYPFYKGMRVSDLVRASGGFVGGAFTSSAELSRSIVANGKIFTVEHSNVDMGAILSGSAAADTLLQPMDTLIIRQIPEWSDRIMVTVGGEVNFPGTYTVKNGETLSELLKRAGGLTSGAFAKGAVYMRESLRDKEQRELDRLRMRLRSDLSATMIQKSQPDQKTAEFSAAILDQLDTAKAVGRMTIDLPEILKGSDRFPDILLKNGDSLFIPKKPQEVTVLGEVMYPTSHIYRKGLTCSDYIRMSGGMAIHADNERVYVIKASGAVQPLHSSSMWFRSRVTVEPGDSIIVPFDTEYISALPLWKDVTGIIYNLAVSAAAISSF
jgi:protein involved in polysaccharide export with SLBB domain